MRFAARRREDPAIDLTPMIDVVFQLVLFFVVTSDFVHRQKPPAGVQVDLPRASADALVTEDHDVRIAMAADGVVYLDDTAVSLDELRAALRVRAGSDPDTLVILRADLGVPHGHVVTVMDLARSEGLTRLAIATDPDAPE